MFKKNASFHCFKKSGKWYTSGRGHFPEAMFAPGGPFDGGGRLKIIIDHNKGWPGLGSGGDEFIRIAIPDDAVSFGYPLYFPAKEPVVFRYE